MGVDMCVDMCLDMCLDMYLDMCVDMCLDLMTTHMQDCPHSHAIRPLCQYRFHVSAMPPQVQTSRFQVGAQVYTTYSADKHSAIKLATTPLP